MQPKLVQSVLVFIHCKKENISIYALGKSISAMLNANSFVQDLNTDQRVR